MWLHRHTPPCVRYQAQPLFLLARHAPFLHFLQNQDLCLEFSLQIYVLSVLPILNQWSIFSQHQSNLHTISGILFYLFMVLLKVNHPIVWWCAQSLFIPPSWKSNESGNQVQFCFPMQPQHLTLFLANGKQIINICRTNQWKWENTFWLRNIVPVADMALWERVRILTFTEPRSVYIQKSIWSACTSCFVHMQMEKMECRHFATGVSFSFRNPSQCFSIVNSKNSTH